MIGRTSFFPIITGRERQTYKSTLFKPRSRKPEKMLSEFLAEAQRIIDEVHKIRDRHKPEIASFDTSPKFEEDGFIYLVFDRMIADGESDQFSYDYHDLRREFSALNESKGSFNPFDIFLRLSKISGGSPLWHAIWIANSSLEHAYSQPASIKDKPEFEPFFFYDAMISVSALAFYVEVAKRYGEEMLMAIINGAEIEVGYSLPSDRD